MLELLTLKRISHDVQGTYGVLLFAQKPIILTLENPWLENRKSISCVPSGQYLCERYSSQRFPSTYQVTNVPGRTNIIFHKGNTMEDTRGCILTGSKFGIIKGDTAILDSRTAFKMFMNTVDNLDSFLLNIMW